MKYTLAAVAALASTVSATAVDLEKRASPLSVDLTPVSDTKVKVALTNTGSTSYNLFYKGTFLDTESPADKLLVSSASSPAKFNGILSRLATSGLSEDSFKAIMAGQTIETEVELAELYEMNENGAYSVLAAGAIPYAELNSTMLTGQALQYSSNTLSLDVDAAKAKAVPFAVDVIAKRTAVQSDCTGSQRSAVLSALSSCRTLATAAATAATSGSASKFQEYFKTTSSSTRSTVAARLRAVASDCGSSTSGSTRTYCTDIYGGCSSNVLAYTLPSYNYIVYCGIYFSELPGVTSQCHAQDRATTTLHEETHAPAVYSPGTQDNGYGYAAATALSSSRAVLNADSYALYANAIYSGC